MLENNFCFTLLGGKKKFKSEKIFAVLGDLDELIAILGLARAFSRKKTLQKIIFKLQDDLIILGGILVGQKKVDFRSKTADLERRIAKLKNRNQKEFIRPGANKVTAFLHLGRALVRRVERRVVGLKEKRFKGIIFFLNRLSLFLFWLAVKEEK